MKKVILLWCFLSVCCLASSSPPLWASWLENGTPLCTDPAEQQAPQITFDGAKGAIVTWHDNRGSGWDVYAQRIDAAGVARWTSDGVALCTVVADQWYPCIASDGAGGAIVAWSDQRSGYNDIYTQRVDANGIVQWNAAGVALCAAVSGQDLPKVVSDGAGGAIVTWEDDRNGNYDIYAQRISASGVAQWTVDGVALCTDAAYQFTPEIVSDGAGGAIVTWYDMRNGGYDIYAQRIAAWGVVQWTLDGVPLCTATGTQSYPKLLADGTGGAIVAWQDARSGNYDVYVQHLDVNGMTEWTANGVPICTEAGSQIACDLTSDGAGGAIITWDDYRNGSHDIYSQRIDVFGVVQWTPDGVPLCTALGTQESPQIMTDGAGGAIVTWHDTRSGSYDIYVQRVGATGAIQWSAGGIALCTASLDQLYPQITVDELGGAIVTWQHDTDTNSFDIHAQQIDAEGRVGYHAPVIHSVRDVPGDQGGWVNVAWYAPPFDYLSGEITEYTLWRALDAQEAQGALAQESVVIVDPEGGGFVAPEVSEAPVLRMDSLNGEVFFWNLISTLDAYRLQGYSEVAATLFDSTAVSNKLHYFQVIAHTSNPAQFYVSAPDSGYSVDNLAPAIPSKLVGTAQYDPMGLHLSWAPNNEADLDGYRVYRGLSPDFLPDPATLIAATSDTNSLDTGWNVGGGYYYKVSALDVHGNESPFALLVPQTVTSVPTPQLPKVAYLQQNYPNPFNPATTIPFGLERASHVSLRVYDLAGRLVRVIAEDERPAGRYTVSWDGKDASGRAVASAVYLCRLEVDETVLTRRMMLLR